MSIFNISVDKYCITEENSFLSMKVEIKSYKYIDKSLLLVG